MEERCVIWRYTFVRDYKPPTYKGYYELLIWAGPRGVLNAQEHLLDKQAANRPKENAADWKVDSTQLMQLTGREGGRDFRKATPKWDAASWSSDKNAVMVARLEFSPYFDVIAAKGKEIPGSKSVV